MHTRGEQAEVVVGTSILISTFFFRTISMVWVVQFVSAGVWYLGVPW